MFYLYNYKFSFRILFWAFFLCVFYVPHSWRSWSLKCFIGVHWASLLKSSFKTLFSLLLSQKWVEVQNVLKIGGYWQFSQRCLWKRMKNEESGIVRTWVSHRHITHWLMKTQTDNLHFARIILWMIYENCSIKTIPSNYSCENILIWSWQASWRQIPDLKPKMWVEKKGYKKLHKQSHKGIYLCYN